MVAFMTHGASMTLLILKQLISLPNFSQHYIEFPLLSTTMTMTKLRR
jgi:hypothetical protein